MKRPLHIALTIAAALLALGAIDAAHAQPAGGAGDRARGIVLEASASEPGFVKFELTGIFSRDLTVQFVNDTLLLPFTAVANSLGIINRVSDDLDTLAGEMPTGNPFTIAIAAGSVTRRGADDTLPRGSIAIIDGEAYVESRALARALGVQIVFDLSELKVTVIADARIPAVERARNRHRYASLGHDAGGATATGSTIRRELFGSAAIRWGIINTLQRGETNSSGSMQIAGPFLFGTLTASGTGQYRREERNDLTGGLSSLGWQIQFPDFSPLRQVTLGATRSGSSTSLTLGLGNAPLGGRQEFGTQSLNGHAQPGWDVELYHDQTLVEVTQADQDGYYQFQIPIGYGATSRTVVLVGPHGERVMEERTFRLNPALVPPGEVQYSTSLFSENTRINGRVRGDAILGVGIFNWLTLGSVASAASSDLGSLGPDSVNVAAHASLWLGDGTPLSLYYNPRKQLVGGAVTYTFSDNFSVQGGIDSFDLRRRNTYAAMGSFSLGMGWLALGGAGQLTNNDMLTTISASPHLSLHVGRLSVSASARLAWQKPHAALGGGPSQMAVASSLQITAAPFGGVFLIARGAYDHNTHKLTNLDISTTISLVSSLSLGVAYSAQDLDWKRGTLYSQLSYNFGLARVSVGGAYLDGEITVANSVEGGFLVSRGGVQSAPYEALNQAGIIINAYHDANLNGTRDGDEKTLPEPSADLVSNADMIHTDDGTFFSLSPYQQSTVSVTRERYAELGLFPRRSEYRVYTLPGATTVIDVPYAEGFVVTGDARVTLPSGKAGSTAILTGLKIRLVSSDGTAEYDGEMFDDGSILIDGVSKGDYRITFDEEQLGSRRLQVSDAPPQVYLSSTGTTLPRITFAPVEAPSTP